MMPKYGAQVRLADPEQMGNQYELYLEVAKGNLAYQFKQYGLVNTDEVKYQIVDGIGEDPDTGKTYATKELYAMWESNG